MRGGADFNIRAGALALAVAAFVALAFPVAAETDGAAVEQWRATDRSMAELVDDGYELVSVVAASGQSHAYFLRKPGKVARRQVPGRRQSKRHAAQGDLFVRAERCQQAPAHGNLLPLHRRSNPQAADPHKANQLHHQ